MLLKAYSLLVTRLHNILLRSKHAGLLLHLRLQSVQLARQLITLLLQANSSPTQ